MEVRPNHLAGQGSPYLAEHAHDPVDWYPWSGEAFAKAKREDKPLFISIGYSTCHWCHVMQKESFQDEEVARMMNKAFVCIKVDREERPDVDSVYMKACQMVTGNGGWPLTIVATPDKKPFFVATYLPKEPRFNMPGIKQLIENVEDLWRNDRATLMKNSESMAKALSSSGKKGPAAKLDKKIFDDAFKQMSEMFDFDNGGFGEAPKFPMALNLLFMLRHSKNAGSKVALKMVERSLECMRMGAVYDQIGGGFHRYATDIMWNVPHFEKMLYDQALLAMVYTEAYQITGKGAYEWTAKETFDFVLREFASKEGAFYTAMDADSEGEEGKFYAFNYNELYNALSPNERDLFFAAFPIKESEGRKALHMDEKMEDIAKEMKIDVETIKKRLDISRNKVFALRLKRKPPNVDNKVLSDLNGLMIAALAKGYVAFNDERYYNAAKSAADFIIDNMMKKDGLLHMKGSTVSGNLSDYSFFILGLIELYQARFESEYLEKACTLMGYVQENFLDKENGGFFSTANDSEFVLVREKPIYDNAVPSGNSAALYAMLALSRLTGNPKFEQSAGKLADAFSRQVADHPSYAPFTLSALSLVLNQSYEVVIVASSKADATKFASEVRKGFRPNVFVAVKDEAISRISEFTKTMETISGRTAAYVCTGNVCKSAVTDPKKAIALIEES
ncbi:MAG TPA: thioredoxin domain-containing protein [Candidatus Acidoferrum sp.]|nr:thioredoxin domain-containing protein [Candidatus Acidoferrum sp.]